MTFVRTFSLLLIYGLVCGVSADRFVAEGKASAAGGEFSGQARAGWITVPAGTRILVRLAETLSSQNQVAGGRFSAVLETNLNAQGLLVVPRGTAIHGRIAAANRAGGMAGSSQLTLELTDIVINGTAHPVVTDSIQQRAQGQGGSTVRNIGLGAGLGSAIGAVAGRGRGAAIGGIAGGALGTARAAGSPGEQVFMGQGTLLEFRLAQPVPLPLP
ncbi:MAG TPA: hypothetical protein VHT24_06475 [Pseudacidobacterium sp.]|nr:hypothetical protein [Pseudacidobacterium sp.]